MALLPKIVVRPQLSAGRVGALKISSYRMKCRCEEQGYILRIWDFSTRVIHGYIDGEEVDTIKPQIKRVELCFAPIGC